MALDQHIYGSTDWHLPSPSSTPKSIAFPDAALKTPKTDTFSHSHFLDAWATPQLNGQQTPVQTPSFVLSTPADQSSISCSLKPRTPEDPEFHVNHFAPYNLPLPPVDATRRLSSSPDPNSARKTSLDSAGQQLTQSRPVTMDFLQMRTPPPTRDANSRRSLQHGAASEFATPVTVIQRTPNQLPTADDLFNQTPFGFTGSLFSPEMMQFPGHGPMSVPPMPHTRLFWDHSNDESQMEVDMPLGIDPFGPTPHRVEQNFDWQAFSTPTTPHVNSQIFRPAHGMSSSGPRASFSSSGMGNGQLSRSSSFVSASVGVDPSMLFSFSNPTTTSFGSMPPVSNKSALDRQPYETQTRDAHEEKIFAKKAKSQHSRSNTNSSSGSIENVRPSLQRSNTDSGFRKSRPSSMDSRMSSQAAASTIPRRSSPLKRQGGGSLVSIPEIRRPRTRLVIDGTGRARTETVPAGEDEETPRENRKQAQQEVRRQYPGLWNEDDTESEDDEPPPTISRNNSFTISQPQPPQRRAMKHARADSGGLERSNSFKIPRPSPRPSLAVFDKASFEMIRPVRKAAENAHRRFSAMDFPSAPQNPRGNDDQQMPDSPGDALKALKRVVAGRQQRVDRASQNTLKAHNQRWAQASADLVNATTPHGHGHYDPLSNSFNASPNATTPSTDRSSHSSESTRCVCSGTDDGQPMIQCESCNKWLHMPCVGLHSSNLPPVYVCIFCTGQTPIARGGRIRGPAAFDSPLTHKSMFRR